MAANTVPLFVDTPLGDAIKFSTANTARDGTGTIADLVIGAADGTRIDGAIVKAEVTTTAGMIRFYYDDTVDVCLIDELIVTAITVGAAVKAWSGVWSPAREIILPSGHAIQVSTHNGEAFNAIPLGADF